MGRRKKRLAKQALGGCESTEKQEKKRKQEELANTIKGLHWKLRKQFRANPDDYESVWHQHRSDTASLQQYAQAMHTLATQHWESHGDTRIHWCRTTALQFFHGHGLRLALEKDARRLAFERAQRQSTIQSETKSDKTNKATSQDETKSNPGNSGSTEREAKIGQNDYSATQEEAKSDESKPLQNPNEAKSPEITNLTQTDSNAEKPEPGAKCGTSGGDASPSGVAKPCSLRDGSNPDSPELIQDSETEITHPFSGKIRLLDVGSCYNPFKEFEEFEPTAIDLCPATETVIQCDFLQLNVIRPHGNLASTPPLHSSNPIPNPNLVNHSANSPASDSSNKTNLKVEVSNTQGSTQISTNAIHNTNNSTPNLITCSSTPNSGNSTQNLTELTQSPTNPCTNPNNPSLNPCNSTQDPSNSAHLSLSPSPSHPLTQLPANSFHCVVFSLLLEYLPSNQQRLQCCIKAHQLLAPNGLLIIVTPDSKSVQHNAPMMKSWKAAIESLGFRRSKYEKLCHLHGMAFRKVTRTVQIEENEYPSLATKLYIHQDFKDEPDEPAPKKKKTLHQSALKVPSL